ncbi:alpha/beta fold hydrolase [Paraburkholderia fynbosensis]|uniref:Fluoroacetate dehalogenase n=1 Tax=Paraburkholderia fynbosensis TaxID=1200993 RepID=A0A6J5GZS8_9BURK|nr:alpha/beta hydrolase [Paraburkholderia fynbosensis]CAB3810027.1 Fluoroacetate dehalogenase [Paraburkholderia fynbosensis]
MFNDFTRFDIEAGDVRFKGVMGGAGAPVLLLHGYPQTHIVWRHIAPVLARSYTVIAPDLPGYGDSRTLSGTPRWTKRRVAHALVELMRKMGHERFGIVGHDRGARSGYRLALDHPARVAAYASLTVVPIIDALDAVDRRFAMNAWHWFFLSQPADLPERMLAAAPDAFIERALARMAGGLDRIDPIALDAYRRAFRDPDVRHAMCEDYRAAVEEDSEYDTADRARGARLACPVLVLWSRRERAGQIATPIDIWRNWADDVSGCGIGGGHLLPEESHEEVLRELVPFLARHVPTKES